MAAERREMRLASERRKFRSDFERVYGLPEYVGQSCTAVSKSTKISLLPVSEGYIRVQ